MIGQLFQELKLKSDMDDLNITLYTDQKDYFNNPPVLMKHSHPQWQKDLPPTLPLFWAKEPIPSKPDVSNPVYGAEMGTMKGCTGLNQFFSNGFTISFPYDMPFYINENIEEGIGVDFNNPTLATHHPMQGFEKWLNVKKYMHLKIEVPWFAETDSEDDTKLLLVKNDWAFDNPEDLIIPPGVVDLKVTFSLNVNCVIPFIGKRCFIIKANTPLVAFIPLSSRKVNIECKLITNDEIKQKKYNHAGNTFDKNRVLSRYPSNASEDFMYDGQPAVIPYRLNQPLPSDYVEMRKCPFNKKD